MEISHFGARGCCAVVNFFLATVFLYTRGLQRDFGIAKSFEKFNVRNIRDNWIVLLRMKQVDDFVIKRLVY